MFRHRGAHNTEISLETIAIIIWQTVYYLIFLLYSISITNACQAGLLEGWRKGMSPKREINIYIHTYISPSYSPLLEVDENVVRVLTIFILKRK